MRVIRAAVAGGAFTVLAGAASGQPTTPGFGAGSAPFLPGGVAVGSSTTMGGGAGGGASYTSVPAAPVSNPQIPPNGGVRPVGQTFPKVGEPVGTPIGNPFSRSDQGLTPQNPGQGNVDPKLIVAPTRGYGTAGGDPSLWQRIKAKLSSVTGVFQSVPDPARPTWTPGLSRRNRERAEMRRFQPD